MKNRYIYQTILLLSVLCIGCNSKTVNKQDILIDMNTNTATTHINNKVERLLKEQLVKGAYAEYEEVGVDAPIGYIFTEEDIDVICPIIQDSLEKRGYKISEKDFSEKIYTIFCLDSVGNVRFNLLEDNNTPLSARWEYFQFNEQQFFVSPKNKLLFNPLLIPELIDYQKYYPDIAKMEDTLSAYNLDGYKITQWKDVFDLSLRRKENWNLLFHRNKYLFNDSQASLTWLINNDSQFLESLVKTFGYVQDKKLLKWVIDRNRFEFENGKTNGLEYGRILWSRDCSGKLRYNKETLAVMKEGLTPDSPIYLHDLLNYVNYLVEKKESQEKLNLSFEEKALIIGNTLYFIQLMAKENKYQLLEFEAMGHFYKFHDHKDEYDKEFAKKNYYGLVGFKEMWEQAKDDGDGVTNYS